MFAFLIQVLLLTLHGVGSDLYNFQTNLDYSGGTFSLDSIPPYGQTGGAQMQVFGLTATITDPGRRYSNSMRAYTTGGIFGSPLLNKQFRLINNGEYLYFSSGLPNKRRRIKQGILAPMGLTLPLKRNKAKDLLAMMIANMCGINLIWMAQDIPVLNFSYEATMNGISALNSLAGRVGATLRWHGNNTYYVASSRG